MFFKSNTHLFDVFIAAFDFLCTHIPMELHYYCCKFVCLAIIFPQPRIDVFGFFYHFLISSLLLEGYSYNKMKDKPEIKCPLHFRKGRDLSIVYLLCTIIHTHDHVLVATGK